MLTPEELRAIKERAERATEGPWHVVDDYQIWAGANSVAIIDGCEINGERTAVDTLDEANAAFIAHARTDVEALLAEVERLRRGIEILGNLADVDADNRSVIACAVLDGDAEQEWWAGQPLPTPPQKEPSNG